MKTTFKRLTLYLIVLISGIFFALSSCKKDAPLKDQPQKISAISGAIKIDQGWINIRNKAKREYDFYFESYYHKRDILREVDWDRAIVSFDNSGNKVMVFLMKHSEEISTDARLMVVQKPGGRN